MEHNILTILVIPKTLVRQGLASLLATTNYKPIMSVASIGDLGQQLTPGTKIELFIISRDALTHTGSEVALPEVETLRKQHPGSKVLVLSDAFNFSDVVAALRAGANGYLMNTLTSDALIKSLDLVMLGETVLTSEFAQAVSETGGKSAEISILPTGPSPAASSEDVDMPCNQLEQASGHQLSSRETAILSRLIQGDSNKHIARGIGVAEATVKTHIKAILRKIRVKNRTQAAMWAYTNLPALPGVDLDIAEPVHTIPSIAASGAGLAAANAASLAAHVAMQATNGAKYAATNGLSLGANGSNIAAMSANLPAGGMTLAANNGTSFVTPGSGLSAKGASLAATNSVSLATNNGTSLPPTGPRLAANGTRHVVNGTRHVTNAT
jgi:two-component system, NarL family, nitrate/nitrite response regulator NarL